MNPDKISNEDYVVDDDKIMEDATQETNTQNDKDEQEIEKMESLLQEMYETDFMSLQLEEKQTQLAGKRKKLHDEAFMAFLAHGGDAKALMCLLKNFATMDTQGILTKHEYMFPVNKYENDYDKRVLAIQDLLKNRDNLNKDDVEESTQKYKEIHFGTGENIVLWTEKTTKPITKKRPAEIDWKNMKKENIPTVLIVEEHIDLEHLEAFAASEAGKKKIYELNGEHEEETNNRGWKDNATAKEVITKFLANVKHKKTFITQFCRSVTGEMLVSEKLISASRLYAKKTKDKTYPWSVTQLPRCLKAVAWKHTFQQNDDASAFQRIIFGKTKVQQARSLTKEVIENREKVFESIIKNGKFKKWVKYSTLRTIENSNILLVFLCICMIYKISEFWSQNL